MARIAKIVPWLKKLFPPAGGISPSATEIGDFITLTHELLNGTDRLNEWIVFSASSAAGVANHASGQAPIDKYWYVFAASCTHNDPVDRQLNLQINVTGLQVGIASTHVLVPAGVQLSAPRRFILPPRSGIRVIADTVAAGQVVKLKMLYMELDLGEPPPRA